MNVGNTIKIRRQSLAISQQELASKAGVSLATLQNIEAEIANPTYELLTNIMDALGITLSCATKEVDWNVMALLGLPISANTTKRKVVKSKENLLYHLKLACAGLETVKAKQDSNRIKDALAGLLLALKTHYPTIYKKKIEKTPVIMQFLPQKISGREIKMRRLSLAILGTYL